MDPLREKQKNSRRGFIEKTALFCSSFPFLPQTIASSSLHFKTMETDILQKSIIGQYGNWASGLLNNPAKLSYRKSEWNNLDQWKPSALKKVDELIGMPAIQKVSEVKIHKTYDYDGLLVEELSWQLSNGGAAEAILLKPKGTVKKLPAILALHDHGGNKYFGKRKITRTQDNRHPLMEEHQGEYYGGMAWANEIAKRGYVVLVHDAFAFGSRRILLEDVEGILWGNASVKQPATPTSEDSKSIENYNQWASEHEHVLSKSLFCAGTTWPGVVLAEDKIALDILSAREDVDPNRMGCAGLSGGGLRTVYLGGLDERIKCAISVGFMSTWSDFLLNKSFTHTWMLYAPLLPKYLEFPEIFGLRVPLPTMVMNNSEDQLFTLSEMEKADNILKDLYQKANAAEKYVSKFYSGPHKFDEEMQSDAFDWLDRWLST